MARATGVRCIAVTNAPRGAAEVCMQSLCDAIPAARGLVEDLVIGAECAAAKPSPAPYLEAMRRLAVPPERCLVFEDSQSGVRAGVAAGVAAVVGVPSSLTLAELRAAGATRTVADWSEVTAEFVRRALDAPRARPPRAAGALSVWRTAPRRVFRGVPLPLLLGGALATCAPAIAVERVLLCRGADAELPAAAMRAAGGGLVLWAWAMQTALAQLPSGGPSGGDAAATTAVASPVPGPLPSAAYRPLMVSLALAAAAQTAIVLRESHALCCGARRLLTASFGAGAAATAIAGLATERARAKAAPA